MSESRILVVDDNALRAERIGTVLDFMDLTPNVYACAGELSLERRTAQDWLAIVVGDIADAAAWNNFLQWLRRDPVHPPVLALPMHHHDGREKFGLNDSNFWPLDYPIRQPQIAELLRRCNNKHLQDAGAAEMPRGGPTGSSAQMQLMRQCRDQRRPIFATVAQRRHFDGKPIEEEVRAAHAITATDTLPSMGLDLKEHIAGIEVRLIRAALDRTDGIVAHAAQLLCLRRTTLVEKLRKYGLSRECGGISTRQG